MERVVFWGKYALGVAIVVMLSLLLYRIYRAAGAPSTEEQTRKELEHINAEIKLLLGEYLHVNEDDSDETVQGIKEFLLRFPDLDPSTGRVTARVNRDLEIAIRGENERNVIILSSIKGLIRKAEALTRRVEEVRRTLTHKQK